MAAESSVPAIDPEQPNPGSHELARSLHGHFELLQELGSGSSGTTVDVAMTNGQTLQYAFTNAQDITTWSGTATVTNVSDGGATLDTFAYTLTDTGSEPVGVGVGGPVGGPPP